MPTQHNKCQICHETCQIKYCTRHAQEIDLELRRLVDATRTALRQDAIGIVAKRWVDECARGRNDAAR